MNAGAFPAVPALGARLRPHRAGRAGSVNGRRARRVGPALVALALALASAPVPAAAGDEAARDFLPEVKTLSRVAACSVDGEVPARLAGRTVDLHCRVLALAAERWRKRWLALAEPFLRRVVPTGLPKRVVYPFGGGDLLTALVTFPDAEEITTLSLEPAGDPRVIDTITPSDLTGALAEVAQGIKNLTAVSHSKTTVMGKLARGVLPGDLTYSLVALAISDNVPTSVRFFHLAPDGHPVYLTDAELAAEGANEPPLSGAQTAAGAKPTFALGRGAAARPATLATPAAPRHPTRAHAFDNVEIVFHARAGGPDRVFRHIAANLDDQHLANDPSVLRHLEAKGTITAITKAASYLLWWKEFSTIREYLLSHMAWMISDSTGIGPEEARAAGFEQVPYGRFVGAFLSIGKIHTASFQKVWSGAPPLAFRFGYPDSAGNSHLLVTRHATPVNAGAPAPASNADGGVDHPTDGGLPMPDTAPPLPLPLPVSGPPTSIPAPPSPAIAASTPLAEVTGKSCAGVYAAPSATSTAPSPTRAASPIPGGAQPSVRPIRCVPSTGQQPPMTPLVPLCAPSANTAMP